MDKESVWSSMQLSTRVRPILLNSRPLTISSKTSTSSSLHSCLENSSSSKAPLRNKTEHILKYFLLILVFISGMTSLALEMCASRLLGAYFGTSLYIWAALIGLILIYLTIGYFLGGRLADRYPSEQILCLITSTAALAIILIPFISQSVLSWS